MKDIGGRVRELEGKLLKLVRIHHRGHEGITPSFRNCSLPICQEISAALAEPARAATHTEEAINHTERDALNRVIGPDARGAYRQAEEVWVAARDFTRMQMLREDTERPDEDPVVSGFVGSFEARIAKSNAERTARLTFEEARERMLDTIEGARQAHVTPNAVNGDLFGKANTDEWERRVTQGVKVIALKDFNDALDKAFPVRDTEQEYDS